MLTEAPAPLTSLSETLEHLRSDLENIQRELDQALEVWRSTLINEKKEFQTQLQNQQQTWNEEDRQWQQQRQAYEQKIHDLQKTFDDQVALTEQNALRALNELDDAWQRDKLQWQQDSSRRIKELESREIHDAHERQKQETAIQELQEQILHLEAQVEDRDRAREAYDRRIHDQESTLQELRSLMEAQPQPPTLDVSVVEEMKASWDREKAVWQQSLYDNIRQIHERESQWAEEREKQDRFLRKLQNEVVQLQGLLARAESRKTFSENFIDTYMRSLESEISVLNEMITQAFTPPPKSALVGHPMRRKTDLPYAFR